ncbi:MAG: wax ester/triacylglycerol synthase family O-acyltransferase [Pseudomonadales bacterium]
MNQRLSAMDALFLYLETAAAPMHISSIYLVEGEVSYQSVLELFESRIHLAPACRRRLAQVPLNLAHPTWVDDPDFDLTNHVKHVQLPNDTTLQGGIDAALELSEPMLDRSRPLWMYYVISGVPDKTLILHINHHAMLDGLAGVQLTTVFYDFEPSGGNRQPPTEIWHPEPIPSPVQRLTEALQDNLINARDSKLLSLFGNAKQRHLINKAISVISRMVTRPVITAPFNAGLVGPKRQAKYIKRSLAEIREIRHALGGTVNDVVLTVVSEAVARYLASHDEPTNGHYMRIMCPVSVRSEDEAGTLGNKVSAVFPVLPAWPMDLVDRLTTVCAETERIKHGEEAQALALTTEIASSIWPVALAPTQLVGTRWDPTVLATKIPLPAWPKSHWRPPNFGYNFVCTNIPGVQVPQYLAGHKVTATIGLLVLSFNVGFSMTIMSYNKELFFSFICEPRLLPDLQTIVEATEASFEELLEAARHREQQLH